MLKQNSLGIFWEWQLMSSPNQLWPFIANTNRMLKDLHQPAIQTEDVASFSSSGFKQLSYKSINRYETWEEEPYEWEYPFRLGVKRHYQSGPYNELNIQIDLLPNKKGTQIKINIQAEPSGNILSLLTTAKLTTLLKRKLKKNIQHYDYLAYNNLKYFQLSKKKRLANGGKKRIKQIREKLSGGQADTEVLEKIINFILKADNLELQNIRPYVLADSWNISRDKVLKSFFYAAEAGLVDLKWDLICPHCLKVQETLKSLSQVHEPVYCDHCQQNFRLNFNKTIRLNFMPNALVRKISYNQYCTHGPHTQPHIFIQQYIKPGESRYLKTTLPVGTYALKATESEGTAKIYVKKSGAHTSHISLTDSGLRGEEANIISNPNLSITNKSSSAQIITLEQQDYNTNYVSAAKATSSQLFRNLFAHQVMKKGEQIYADDLTLMFTDLFDSTGIYKNQGDDVALRHVLDHFQILQHTVEEENGAIVKTIGDSVMAVFYSPDQALRAFLRAKELLSEDKSTLLLKAGIHHGKCMATNLNHKIDYFGSTVNVASRLVDYASRNEIIISQGACSAAETDIQQILQEFDQKYTMQTTTALLKGFEDEAFAIKSIAIDNSLLRLVV